MPDDDRKFIAGAFAEIDRAITGQFQSGLNHGITIGRQSAAAALEYAGHGEAAALVRAMGAPADSRAALLARVRWLADEMEAVSVALGYPAGELWFPAKLRREADRHEHPERYR